MSTPSAYAHELQELGRAGVLPPLPTDLTVLDGLARATLQPGPFGYVSATASSGATARANRAAFDRWRLVPRMLTGNTERSLATTLFGTPVAAPVALAPLAAQGILHPDGELAAAAESAALGLPMILSTLSSRSLEEVAAASGSGTRWFQLYRPNDDEICLSFLHRARVAGYSALVVTIDNWTFGWRPGELDAGYLPFPLGHGLGTYFSDPVFRGRLSRPPEQDLAGAHEAWRALFAGRDRTWADLAFLREHWDGPLLVKGVQHPDDARQAIDAGVDAVIVSNHGGRQVDGAIASLDALPGVVTAVAGAVPVLFDSGVRVGADVAKAVALGAAAALVGRPYAYGLGLAGRAGVRHVLRTLLADLDLTLALSGVASVAALGPHSLQEASCATS